MHFHYMTYMVTPLHKNLCPRCHEIYNFRRPFLVRHYYILGLSDLCLGVEKKIFKEKMHFHYMTYMAKPLHPYPRGHEIYNFGTPFLPEFYGHGENNQDDSFVYTSNQQSIFFNHTHKLTMKMTSVHGYEITCVPFYRL